MRTEMNWNDRIVYDSIVQQTTYLTNKNLCYARGIKPDPRKQCQLFEILDGHLQRYPKAGYSKERIWCKY